MTTNKFHCVTVRGWVYFMIVGALAQAAIRAEEPLHPLEGIDTSIAYYGESGFVFPKATAIKSTDKQIGLPEAVAEYLLLQLNRTIHNKLTSNEFVQRVFGVSSVGEEEENSNFVIRLVAQLDASRTSNRPCELKKDSVPRMLVGGGGWTNFVVDCRIKNSKYRRAVLFFSVEAPFAIAGAEGSTFTAANFTNKDGHMESYLCVGSLYFAY